MTCRIARRRHFDRRHPDQRHPVLPRLEADRVEDGPQLLHLLQLVQVRRHRSHPIRTSRSLQRKNLFRH